MGLRELVKQALVKRQDNQYERELARRRIPYDRWIRERELQREVLSGPESADIVIFYAQEGWLSTRAEKALNGYFLQNPQILLVYGDEDVCASENGERHDPWFRPDWSPETFRSCFYFGSVFAVRRELLDGCGYPGAAADTGRLEYGIEAPGHNAFGAKNGPSLVRYHDFEKIRQLAGRLVVRAGGFLPGCRSIGHIHEILFHAKDSKIWENYLQSSDLADKWLEEKGTAAAGNRRVDSKEFRIAGAETSVPPVWADERMTETIVQPSQSVELMSETIKAPGQSVELMSETIKAPGQSVELMSETIKAPDQSVTRMPEAASEQTAGRVRTLSVIIPSKDHPGMLKQAILSLLENAGVQADGVRSLEEAGAAVLGVSLSMELIIVDNGSSPRNREETERFLESCRKWLPVRYVYREMPFHFSRMCNEGARCAKGELLLFLNDDVELGGSGTLDHLARLASEPFAGAAGLKLLYPDTGRIQHAGIVNLPMGPVHKLQFLTDAETYAFGRNRLDINVLAVTGACLMLRSKIFWEAGGFPEELPVAFNDVALCFRLYELGYSNVTANSREAIHRESVSRGDDESPAKLERLYRERSRLYSLFPKLAGKDPYYPEELNRDSLDTRIRPACETAGNRPQTAAAEKSDLRLDRYREDACLLFRLEYCGGERIQGYGVVLGDDNACYDRALVFVPEAGDSLYRMALTPQYRPDLVENMPDQRNTGLCGFLVQWDSAVLPEGKYRIAMTADSRVSGVRLISWSAGRLDRV